MNRLFGRVIIAKKHVIHPLLSRPSLPPFPMRTNPITRGSPSKSRPSWDQANIRMGVQNSLNASSVYLLGCFSNSAQLKENKAMTIWGQK
uniref:Uncharacterized protein n=1 Tax=Mycena chlorophos TaxID=658473 RepID=A0ABQ0LDR7_MYCCL|nr:predicted protein [Mycena chlorophos]